MKKAKISDPRDYIYFYDELNINMIEYSMFQTYARQRTVFHRQIESKNERGDSITINNVDDDIKQHFCCRLISAQALWSTIKFIRNETQIFEKRIERSSIATIRKFFYEEVIDRLSNIEINKTKKEIIIHYNAQYSVNKINEVGNIKDWTIKMYFSNVIDCIQNMEVDLTEGFVINNETTMKFFIINIFRKFLEEKTMKLYLQCKYDHDDRLLKLSEMIISNENKPIDTAPLLKDDEKYFPPCITGLIQKLKKNNHLKYNDRLVLSRFLKDSGMTVEECINFFRSNFKADKVNFDKEYLYSIRHTYGLEGKRANYRSHSCSQLISVGKDKVSFGCPFQNNQTYVGEYTKEKNIEEPVLFDIEELVKKWKLQEACTVLLGSLMNEKLPEDEVLESPIVFFKKNRKKNKNNEIK